MPPKGKPVKQAKDGILAFTEAEKVNFSWGVVKRLQDSIHLRSIVGLPIPWQGKGKGQGRFIFHPHATAGEAHARALQSKGTISEDHPRVRLIGDGGGCRRPAVSSFPLARFPRRGQEGMAKVDRVGGKGAMVEPMKKGLAESEDDVARKRGEGGTVATTRAHPQAA